MITDKCHMCGTKDNLNIVPSMSQLIFGSFPNMHVTYERRCQKCERKIAKQIRKVLKNET